MRRTIFFTILLSIPFFLLAACGEETPSTPTPTPPAVSQPTVSQPTVSQPAESQAAESQPAASQTVEVLMNDIWFGDTPDNMKSPPTWPIKSGEEVTLALTNKGGLQHDWAIVKLGEEVPIPFNLDQNKDKLLFDAGTVESGKVKDIPFTAPTQGTYLIICTVAGHYPAMQGKLVVE